MLISKRPFIVVVLKQLFNPNNNRLNPRAEELAKYYIIANMFDCSFYIYTKSECQKITFFLCNHVIK